MYENIVKLSLIILSVVVIVILLIKRFIYFEPTTEFIPYKDNYQDISEGNLHGWFIGDKVNKPTILIFHGNKGNISHRQSLIDPLVEMGYSVMIFDYSGYGRSIGVPSEKQFYHDASIFINILLEFVNKDNIILYGESMGASIASYIARKYQINILIIDSGLPSIKKYIKSHYSIIYFLLGFIFSEFNTEDYLKGYKGRTLVMHSPTDEIIFYNTTDIIRENATEVIKIQGSHNNRIIPWDKIDLFIKKNSIIINDTKEKL